MMSFLSWLCTFVHVMFVYTSITPGYFNFQILYIIIIIIYIQFIVCISLTKMYTHTIESIQ